MKGYEATSMKEWEESDRTPTFTAFKRSADGKLGLWDMVLQICTTVVLDSPSEEHLKSMTFEMEITAKTEPAIQTALAVHHALCMKHLRSASGRKDRGHQRKISRELIIDILVNKPDWKAYSSIFAAFAERNDRNFFEQIARGLQRKRMRPFNAAETFSLMNWHEWGACPVLAAMPKQPPTLKYWTPEAAVELIRLGVAVSNDFEERYARGIDSMWTRLGLKRMKPAKVVSFIPALDGSEAYKLETVD